MKDFIIKYKIQLIIGLYAILAASFFYFIITPLVERIIAKADTIQQSKVDAELNDKRLSMVSAMENNYTEFSSNENSFDITIDAAREVDFIKELEVLADQTGNKIEFKVQDPIDTKTSSKAKGAENDIKSRLSYSNYLSMQIALEGSYSGLLNFVHKLENYKNYVNIIGISSEKKVTANVVGSSSPFSTANSVQTKLAADKESVNSILDVVVYIKK